MAVAETFGAADNRASRRAIGRRRISGCTDQACDVKLLLANPEAAVDPTFTCGAFLFLVEGSAVLQPRGGRSLLGRARPPFA